MPLSLSPANVEEFSVESRDTSPANLLIKIESFSLLSKYGISRYESREFEAGDYKWKLIIYPDGHESGKQGDSSKAREEDEHVFVDLWASGTSSLPVNWEINAIFTFLIYDQIAGNYLCFRGMSRRFNALNPKRGISKLISKESLKDPSNGYLVDDSCVFGAEVYVIKSQRINECLSLLKESAPCKRDWELSSFSKLEDVWQSPEFCVGDHKWKVKVYPKGSKLPKGSHISIFLCWLVDSKSFGTHHKVKAEVLMRIKSKLRDNHCTRNFNHWFTKPGEVWGYLEFMAIGDVINPSKGFLVDDCCFLEIEISLQAVVLDAPQI